MSLWFDAGIRDLANNSVSTTSCGRRGAARATWQLPIGVYAITSAALEAGANNDDANDGTDDPVDRSAEARLPALRRPRRDRGRDQQRRRSPRRHGECSSSITRDRRSRGSISTLARRRSHRHRRRRPDARELDQAFTSPTTGTAESAATRCSCRLVTTCPRTPARHIPWSTCCTAMASNPTDLVSLSAIVATYMSSTASHSRRGSRSSSSCSRTWALPSPEKKWRARSRPVATAAKKARFFLNSPLGNHRAGRDRGDSRADGLHQRELPHEGRVERVGH